MKTPQRMCIYQPSETGRHHEWHGVNVLADYLGGDLYRCYFLSGTTFCTDIPKNSLRFGWLESARRQVERGPGKGEQMLDLDELLVACGQDLTDEQVRQAADSLRTEPHEIEAALLNAERRVCARRCKEALEALSDKQLADAVRDSKLEEASAIAGRDEQIMYLTAYGYDATEMVDGD